MRPIRILGFLKSQLTEHCLKLPPDSDAALECWEAYDYFANEAGGAEQQCVIESPGNLAGQACNNFLQWESFVRQVGAVMYPS